MTSFFFFRYKRMFGKLLQLIHDSNREVGIDSFFQIFSSQSWLKISHSRRNMSYRRNKPFTTAFPRHARSTRCPAIYRSDRYHTLATKTVCVFKRKHLHTRTSVYEKSKRTLERRADADIRTLRISCSTSKPAQCDLTLFGFKTQQIKISIISLENVEWSRWNRDKK